MLSVCPPNLDTCFRERGSQIRMTRSGVPAPMRDPDGVVPREYTDAGGLGSSTAKQGRKTISNCRDGEAKAGRRTERTASTFSDVPQLDLAIETTTRDPVGLPRSRQASDVITMSTNLCRGDLVVMIGRVRIPG